MSTTEVKIDKIHDEYVFLLQNNDLRRLERRKMYEKRQQPGTYNYYGLQSIFQIETVDL